MRSRMVAWQGLRLSIKELLEVLHADTVKSVYRVWQANKNKVVTYQTYCAGTDSPAWVLSEVGSDRESDVKAALTSPSCDSLCAALVENYSLTGSSASMTTHQLLSTLRMDKYGEEAVGTIEKGHVFAAAISKLDVIHYY